MNQNTMATPDSNMKNKNLNTQRKFHFLLLVPTLIVMILTLMIPLSLVLIESFENKAGHFSFVQYAKAFTNSYFISSLGFTVLLSFGVSIVSIVLSLPLAYFLARNEKLRNVMLGVVTIPRMLPFLLWDIQ